MVFFRFCERCGERFQPDAKRVKVCYKCKEKNWKERLTRGCEEERQKLKQKESEDLKKKPKKQNQKNQKR